MIEIGDLLGFGGEREKSIVRFQHMDSDQQCRAWQKGVDGCGQTQRVQFYILTLNSLQDFQMMSSFGYIAVGCVNLELRRKGFKQRFVKPCGWKGLPRFGQRARRAKETKNEQLERQQENNQNMTETNGRMFHGGMGFKWSTRSMPPRLCNTD